MLSPVVDLPFVSRRTHGVRAGALPERELPRGSSHSQGGLVPSGVLPGTPTPPPTRARRASRPSPSSSRTRAARRRRGCARSARPGGAPPQAAPRSRAASKGGSTATLAARATRGGRPRRRRTRPRQHRTRPRRPRTRPRLCGKRRSCAACTANGGRARQSRRPSGTTGRPTRPRRPCMKARCATRCGFKIPLWAQPSVGVRRSGSPAPRGAQRRVVGSRLGTGRAGPSCRLCRQPRHRRPMLKRGHGSSGVYRSCGWDVDIKSSPQALGRTGTPRRQGVVVPCHSRFFFGLGQYAAKSLDG